MFTGTKAKIPDGIPPRFPKKPTIRQEGDNLIMECILEANPMPEITWFRKDVPIKENNRLSYECMKAKKHRFLLTLTISNPSLQDGGMYRCNAFNPFGDSNANIDLNFESKFLQQHSSYLIIFYHFFFLLCHVIPVALLLIQTPYFYTCIQSWS